MNPLSIQLYTVRNLLADDCAGTLERLAGIGYTQVEPFAFLSNKEELAENLPRLGLTAPTAHLRLVGEEAADQGAFAQEVFDTARRLGITTVIDPMIDPARWSTREDVLGVAAELQDWAERAADHGLRIGYHNHAFELRNRISGTPALEVFAEAVGDAVDLEVDTYWAEVGGTPAADLVQRLGEQVTALHIKDGPVTERNKDQVAVGAGRMPVEKILSAAPQALAVVELDDTEQDILTAVRQSYEHLTGQALAGAPAGGAA